VSAKATAKTNIYIYILKSQEIKVKKYFGEMWRKSGGKTLDLHRRPESHRMERNMMTTVGHFLMENAESEDHE